MLEKMITTWISDPVTRPILKDVLRDFRWVKHLKEQFQTGHIKFTLGHFNLKSWTGHPKFLDLTDAFMF